jgi:hypothetical protein
LNLLLLKQGIALFLPHYIWRKTHCCFLCCAPYERVPLWTTTTLNLCVLSWRCLGAFRPWRESRKRQNDYDFIWHSLKRTMAAERSIHLTALFNRSYCPYQRLHEAVSNWSNIWKRYTSK